MEKGDHAMISFAGGLVALVLGSIGIVVWWSSFLEIFMGVIPLILILGGALATYLEIKELKYKKSAESFDADKDDLKRGSRPLKPELNELKDKTLIIDNAERGGSGRMNNDNLVPSADLIQRQNIGDGNFIEIGDGMIAGLISMGYLKPNYRILDVGCGLGRLARPLTKFLDHSGEYYGFDIAKDSIEWCESHYSVYENFHFLWADLHSKFYNPDGKLGASSHEFPYQNDFFDFVMLTSVFTHLMPADVDNYLSEIARVLKSNCRCYATYFLLREEEKVKIENSPSDGQTVNTPIDGGYIRDANIPEKMVLLEEQPIIDLYHKHNLEIERITYGTWCGRPQGNYQDEIVSIKR